ncbi:hypothetical protein [Burkholderia sp. Z1]|uniref:hypothetical protein n=1 Tax=Burkholderia sp. Z1 TaxID=2759039 RepID=UPI001868F4AC|nr:hypothetical protein [Burkholderia sp. Z1]
MNETVSGVVVGVAAEFADYAAESRTFAANAASPRSDITRLGAKWLDDLAPGDIRLVA